MCSCLLSDRQYSLVYICVHREPGEADTLRDTVRVSRFYLRSGGRDREAFLPQVQARSTASGGTPP